MEIVEYRHFRDVDVKFYEGHIIKNVRYDHFKTGKIKNVFDRSVYEIGFIGLGEYSPTKNGKRLRHYETWFDMLRRCYSKEFHNENPSYETCVVHENWHNFQEFAKWYDDNFYSIENEKMSIDKDIFSNGAKIYSPDTCVFVPSSINNFFIIFKNGNEYPGVHFSKEKNKYIAQCGDGKQNKGIGGYDTPEDAFLAYKLTKEKRAKELAEKYRNKIPIKLYKALINFTIEKQSK